MYSITVSLAFIFYFVSIFVPELCFVYFLWSVVQLLSSVWLFASPWTAECRASLFFTISWSLLELMTIESVMPSSHLVLCPPLLLLPSIFPSIRVFSNELALRIRWPNYWSFSISISPSKGYSGLISFRIDWFNLFAVQGTLKSLLQHHSLKASILWCSAFFMVQLSHPYMWKWKSLGRAFATRLYSPWYPCPTLCECPTLCDPTTYSV